MAARAKILVVDDELGIRFFLQEVLERDGHQVVAVNNGEAALIEIGRQEFDLALVDLKMKGIGGIEVLMGIHQHSPETVVIVLTAHASLESAVDALRQGAHDYLFKPCKTVQIRASVHAGLAKRRQTLQRQEMIHQLQQRLTNTTPEGQADPSIQTPPTAASADTTEGRRFLHRGRLIIDLIRHIVTLDGRLLELSPTEFDLLAYLTSESPRVISPQELVRKVRGYESDAWEARDIVRYHIYRIRRKVKSATGDTSLIRNVRGVGYTLDE